MLETLHLSVFREQLQSQFQVDLGSAEPVTLQLTQAADLGSTPRQERFSVVFRGPLDPYLDQRMYPIEHAALGKFDLFLVPIAREPEGFLYEAVFNRLVDQK
ncbi:MAG TPA: hypothetical protein VD902_06565 [Symbiobacteriaceae bacterium]|nr:hypothetical protein [Symbiobacteriaceae bacterium]